MQSRLTRTFGIKWQPQVRKKHMLWGGIPQRKWMGAFQGGGQGQLGGVSMPRPANAEVWR